MLINCLKNTIKGIKNLKINKFKSKIYYKELGLQQIDY